MKYEHLLARKFVHGRTDCYALVRDFYRDNYGLALRNYARPDNHWDLGFDLYMSSFYAEGFRVLDVHPSEWRPGDAVLMAIQSPVANHAGIFVENGKMLHHLWGGISEVTDYRLLYRNTTVAVVRHKDIKVETKIEKMDLLDVLPDGIRRKVAAAMARGREGARGSDPA